MPGVKILPRVITSALRAIDHTLHLSSFLTLKTALRLQLPIIAVLSLFSGCNRPGSINLPYEIAKNPGQAAVELFKLTCPHIKDITSPEMKTFSDQMKALNPDPLETPWVRWRGANFIPPACPTRTCPKPKTDIGVKKPEIKPDSKPVEIKLPIKKSKKIQRQKPDAGAGVMIKP